MERWLQASQGQDHSCEGQLTDLPELRNCRPWEGCKEGQQHLMLKLNDFGYRFICYHGVTAPG